MKNGNKNNNKAGRKPPHGKSHDRPHKGGGYKDGGSKSGAAKAGGHKSGGYKSDARKSDGYKSDSRKSDGPKSRGPRSDAPPSGGRDFKPARAGASTDKRPARHERPDRSERPARHDSKPGGRKHGGMDGKPPRSGAGPDKRPARPYKSDDRRSDARKSDDRKPDTRKFAPKGAPGRPRPEGGAQRYKPRSGPRDRDAAPQPDIKGLSANLWGIHAVEEAWMNPARRIQRLYVTETALEAFEAVRDRAAQQGLKRPEPFMVDRRTLDRILPPGAVHQGLAVDAVPLEELFVQDLLTAAMQKERATLLILDQLTDPHNVGAIMRSASAFGAAGIIMQTRHSPEITGVLAKSACGAVEHIAVAYETNLGRALTFLQENGFTAIGLDERGETTLAEAEKPARAVLVLGAEGKGLRQHLREQCDILARLPTQGQIRSLNVSNAAAVALYALL